MMCNGLSEANALSHPFAIARHFALGDLSHASALKGFVCELRCLVAAKAMKTQRPINEVVAVCAGRKGVELRAESSLPEKLDGLPRGKAEHVNCTLRRPNQAS